MKMLSRHHKETSSAYRRRKSTANHRRNTATNRCAVLHKVRPYSEISGGQYRRLAADVGAINSSTRLLVILKSYQLTGNKLTFSRLLTFECSPHTLLPLSKAIRGRGGRQGGVLLPREENINSTRGSNILVAGEGKRGKLPVNR